MQRSICAKKERVSKELKIVNETIEIDSLVLVV